MRGEGGCRTRGAGSNEIGGRGEVRQGRGNEGEGETGDNGNRNM